MKNTVVLKLKVLYSLSVQNLFAIAWLVNIFSI